MTPASFVIWLRGWLDITLAREDKASVILFKSQIEVIKRKLDSIDRVQVPPYPTQVVDTSEPWASAETIRDVVSPL